MQRKSTDTEELISRAGSGDEQALNLLFSRHRERLRRMVEMRLDWRIQARLDASDILQDAYAEAAERLPEHTQDPKVPFFLWLRLIVGERLATNTDSGSIHVWNLRAIRAQLAELQLDWDLPAYPPEVAASGSVR
jgi:DNA-directed RNA polymerase specialized sigma24 family protein